MSGTLANVYSTSINKKTDYVGNVIYENDNLKRILVDGGYWEDGQYHFYLTDHLGNNRVVVKADGTTIVQKSDYYPFGMSIAENTGSEAQPYKYNGKELDKMHGLNLYDYSARHYDAAISRFTTVDPRAEDFYSWSPYMYSYNNPIRFIDPDGEGPGDMVKEFFGGYVKGVKNATVAIITAPTTVASIVFNEASKTTPSIINPNVNTTPSPNEFIEKAVETGKVMLPAADLAETITNEISNGGDGTKSIRATGEFLGKATVDALTLGLGTKASAASKISNPVPSKLARVIPAEIEGKTLGAKGSSDVFVTAAKDIKGLDAKGIAKKLTIPYNPKGFKIIEFKTPIEGISSPIKRDNPGFVGGGRTAGGAREFTIPNQKIPENAKIKIVQ